MVNEVQFYKCPRTSPGNVIVQKIDQCLAKEALNSIPAEEAFPQ